MTQTHEDDNNPGLGSVSVAAVSQYLKTAEACGLSFDDALADAGITRETLSDNNRRIPGASLETLLAHLIPESGDPFFGLHTSAHVEPASFSVLGYIAMNCADLSEVLAFIPVYERIITDMGRTTVHQGPEATWVCWHCRFTDPLVRRHVIENTLASSTRFSQWVVDHHDSPLEVYLEHGPPQDARLMSEYEAVFDAPVHFHQPYNALVVGPDQLAKPVRQPDSVLLQTLLAHARQLLAEIEQCESVTGQVKNWLRLMMGEELPRREMVAEQMGMTSRTLQRKLNAEGTGYQTLLKELRLELAQDYLRSSRLSVDEIAFRLGYAEPRSFHRNFKQWTGYTPGEFRSGQLGEALD